MLAFRLFASMLTLGWIAACEMLVLLAPFVWSGMGLVVLIALALGAPMVLKLFWPELAPDAVMPQPPFPEAENEESPASAIMHQLAWGLGLLVTGILGWALDFITSDFFGFLAVLALVLVLKAVLPEKVQTFLGLRTEPDDPGRNEVLPEGEIQRLRNQTCMTMLLFGFLATFVHFLVPGFISAAGWSWEIMPLVTLMLVLLSLFLGAGVLIPGSRGGHRSAGEAHHSYKYPLLRGVALMMALCVLNLSLEAIYRNHYEVMISGYVAYVAALLLLPGVATMAMPELRRWSWPWLKRSR